MSIVDKPDQVTITESNGKNRSVLLTIEVEEDDVGKVLGKAGKTIRMIEAFLQIVYMVDGSRVFVDVGGPNRHRGEQSK